MNREIFILAHNNIICKYFLDKACDCTDYYVGNAFSVFTIEDSLPIKHRGIKYLELKKGIKKEDIKKNLFKWAFMRLQSDFPTAFITRYDVPAWLDGEWLAEEVRGTPPINRENQIEALTVNQKIEILKEATSFTRLIYKTSYVETEREINEVTQRFYDKLLNMIII